MTRRTTKRKAPGGRRPKRRPSRWWPTPRVWLGTTFVAGILIGGAGLYAVGQLDREPTPPAEIQAANTETSAPAPMPEPAAPAVDTASVPHVEAPALEPAPAVTPAPQSETTLASAAPAPVPAPVPTIEAPDPARLAALRALPPSTAWLSHALPPVRTGGRPMIAIVIDDVGVDRVHAPGAIALPAPVTLSFMSYAEGLAAMTQEARARGHELMLHLPMEPTDPKVDPGPRGLRVTQSAAEIASNVEWALDRFDGYIGVNNHMGSRFTRSTEGMQIVLAALRERGLMFLDSRTVGDSVGARVATDLGVPNLSRDVFLDNDPSSPAIAAQLGELERIARERGYAIGIGHPYTTTLEALNTWLPTLEARGFVVVPVSTILRQKLGVAG